MKSISFKKQILFISIIVFVFLFLYGAKTFAESNKEVKDNSVAIDSSSEEEPPMSRKVKKFIKDLEDPESDDDTRHTAVWALGNLGDKRAVPYLIEVLKTDKNENIRSIAAEALGKLGDKRSVEPLIKALGDTDWGVRVDAIFALGRMKDLSAEAIPDIIKTLKDEDETVRLTAAKILGEFEDPIAVDPLCDLLNDKNERVKTSAIVSLGILGDEKAIKPLGEVMEKDKSEFVKVAVIQALREIKGEQAISLVISSLDDKNTFVRLYAVTTLGKIGNKEALTALEKMAKTEEDPDIKEAIDKAIEEIKSAI